MSELQLNTVMGQIAGSVTNCEDMEPEGKERQEKYDA